MAGATFLWVVGALPGMVTRNIAAYAVGLAIGFGALHLSRRSWGFPSLLAGASLLLLLTLVGIEVDGVRRWIGLGPITLQPALIVLPMLLAVTGSESRRWDPWLAFPGALIALQPDAASLAALAAAMAVMVRRNGPRMLAATLLVVTLAAMTLSGMHSPPPAPFVEGTAATALASGPAALALHFAAVALMAAAPLSWKSPSGLVVAAYFLLSAIIAMLWAFPMPIAGAAPSHLLGFGGAMAILAGRQRIGSEA